MIKFDYNKPYKLMYPDRYPNKAILDYNWRERKTERVIFMEGVFLPAPDIGRLHLSQDPKTYDLIYEAEVPEDYLLKYDILPNNGTAPLVNKRVLNILQNLCPNDFQDFPTIVKNVNPKIPYFENNNYSLINITQLVKSIDYNKSPNVVKEEDGSIMSLNGAFFKENCMEGHHLAREKDFTALILASPTLVRLFKEEKIKGVQFLKESENWF